MRVLQVIHQRKGKLRKHQRVWKYYLKPLLTRSVEALASLQWWISKFHRYQHRVLEMFSLMDRALGGPTSAISNYMAYLSLGQPNLMLGNGRLVLTNLVGMCLVHRLWELSSICSQEYKVPPGQGMLP